MSTSHEHTAPDAYDVIVIGGGPPGEVVAQYAIQGSDRTAAIVEYELVGGECSYWACMPSKALLRPADVLASAQNLAGTKEIVGEQRLDVDAVLARRDSFTHKRDDASQVQWATGAGIDIVRGFGRLSGVRTVTVTAADGSVRQLRAREAVVIATGSSASIPPVTGLREALPWTSRDATNLVQVPERIVVIGGGVVACEAATWLAALGATVTVVEHGPRLLAKNEPFAGDLVREGLSKAGVDVRTGVAATAVQRNDPQDTGYGHIHGGTVTVTLDDGATVVANEVLIAAGRTPNSADLGLEIVDVDASHDGKPGFIETDDRMTVPGIDGDWLYAVGDITGRALLTHMGKYQARIAGWVIAARATGQFLDDARFSDVADHDKVPQVTFTDPQVASVGHTEQTARDAGIDVETVEYDAANLAGTALLRDDYTGRAKLVIDASRDVLIGATFVGPEIGELVHAATVAIIGAVPMDMLWHAVPSYPTVSELWLRLLEAR